MFRIDAYGNVANRFVEGNPGTGQPATRVSGEWLNAVQEELCAILTAAGVEPDKANSGQIASAIAVLSAANHFGPTQNFSNGAHFGGSPLTGVAMRVEPASSDAVNVAYLQTQAHAAAVAHCIGAVVHPSYNGAPVVRGPVTAALTNSPAYVVRITFNTAFESAPVITATAEDATGNHANMFSVTLGAVTATYVDLMVLNAAGQQVQLDALQPGHIYIHMVAVGVS